MGVDAEGDGGGMRNTRSLRHMMLEKNGFLLWLEAKRVGVYIYGFEGKER